ncbi:MAG TPA: MFS transporter [Thermomicrobiales bacterium]|nr:MFS transporter [Thermomicrobiales bacterium]
MRGTAWLSDSPLANRDYSLFLGGAFVSSLGSWMQSVALGWTVLQLGKSAFLLGLLGFVQTAPVLVLGLLAGTLADNADRRQILLITQGAMTVLAAILAAIQGAGHATVAALLAISLGNGIVQALNGPTWQAFIKELVGPEQLRRAVAINSARFNLTRIIGPAVGGWVLVVWGAAACFAANAVSFLAVIAAIAAIRPHRDPATIKAGPVPGNYRDVARNPNVREVLIPAIGLCVLALPYSSFLPAMAEDVFHTGASGLSILLTATGVGAVCGAFISGSRLVARRPGQALAVLEIVAGLALAGFALAPSFALGIVGIVVFGASLIGYLATAGATLQLAAVPGTEGRALGLWMIVNSGLVPLGSLAIGAATAVVSVPVALGAAGIICAVCGVVAVYVNRRAVTRARAGKVGALS